MTAYYNEIDPFAAETLRNLITAGLIAPGDVDTRSIMDVRPDDLRPYTQCHFFAGVGVWSYALRLAGWPDDRQVWTGSCPCQPFSTTGKRAGFNDERHLWPYWQWLIQECNPAELFGEQVASKDAAPWIDLVQADLEAMGYAFGCIPFPSAGIGAPHIRDRAYWVGYAGGEGLEGFSGHGHNGYQPGRVWTHSAGPASPASGSLRVADMHGNGCDQARECVAASGDERIIGNVRIIERQPTTGPVNGFWADADWLYCRDGKWRPVRPGTFPLVNGAPARVGRLRAYGNAINAYAAKAFIECFMEIDGTVITP